MGSQRSYFWNCAEIGDGGLDSFSQEAVMTILGMINSTYNPEGSGVIPWASSNTTIASNLGLGALPFDEQLEPRVVAVGDDVSVIIQPGIAVVGGIYYISTQDHTFDIVAERSSFSLARDRIVLRRSLVDQTARFVYLQATAADETAAMTHSNLYWDIPIARVFMDISGDYQGVLDDRVFATSPMAGRVLLYNENLTASSPPAHVGHDFTLPEGFSSIEVEIIVAANENITFFLNDDQGSNYYSEGTPPTSQTGVNIFPGTIGRPSSYRLYLPFYSTRGAGASPTSPSTYPVQTPIYVDGVQNFISGGALTRSATTSVYENGANTPITKISAYTTGSVATLTVTMFIMRVYGIK